MLCILLSTLQVLTHFSPHNDLGGNHSCHSHFREVREEDRERPSHLLRIIQHSCTQGSSSGSSALDPHNLCSVTCIRSRCAMDGPVWLAILVSFLLFPCLMNIFVHTSLCLLLFFLRYSYVLEVLCPSGGCQFKE